VPVAKRVKNKTAKLAKGKAPAVLLPYEVARFMDAVITETPRMVPFWSLKFFAGIRDAEAARMEWSMINIKAGEIHLPATVSKTGEARTVKILPNLAAWLRPHAATAGPIAPGDMARRYDYKKVLASLATKDAKGNVTKAFTFPSNAARHSFGTFHLFHFRNAGETALQLGHKSNPAMLHEHYKNPTAEKHAAAFWKIYPTVAKNVISIDHAAVEENESTNPQRKTAP
jgi:integrase